MSNINFTAVESSQISGYHYNAEARVLTVKFNRGGIYEYSDVPDQVVDAVFVKSSSVGSAFAANIKNNPHNYPYRKIG
ncbi:hypothetical protein PJWF_00067 [Achromobacter phage JWF]|uniref:hypothetical protein n=1 Tax=Achromobacter phage JWF TaxID=1589748 RepID=UPI000588DF61|nr:hypothetical protein AXJ13_gp067 [Achromobacter phage JWF]AJD82961.1 hypothetical protein PJWF_00067 [Achromobacter phage JWF]